MLQIKGKTGENTLIQLPPSKAAAAAMLPDKSFSPSRTRVENRFRASGNLLGPLTSPAHLTPAGHQSVRAPPAPTPASRPYPRSARPRPAPLRPVRVSAYGTRPEMNFAGLWWSGHCVRARGRVHARPHIGGQIPRGKNVEGKEGTKGKREGGRKLLKTMKGRKEGKGREGGKQSKEGPKRRGGLAGLKSVRSASPLRAPPSGGGGLAPTYRT